MPQVVAYEDAKAHQLTREHNAKIPFLMSTAGTPTSPMAYIIREDPQKITKPHFHAVDQFQLIIEGKGKFGRHDVSPYYLHFARAYTPYGPLVPDKNTGGWAFLTLRAHFDPGAQFLPKSKDVLTQMADHQPWQISRHIEFSTERTEVALASVPDMKDDQGLSAYSLVMRPNANTAAPDPSFGNGQFLVVVNGSLWHNNKEYGARTVIFVEPNEGPFQVNAGKEGLQAVIVNFPQNKVRLGTRDVLNTVSGPKKWHCTLCSFSYDEAIGLPDDGIAAGTRWEDIPESWTCPDCSASKSDFQIRST